MSIIVVVLKSKKKIFPVERDFKYLFEKSLLSAFDFYEQNENILRKIGFHGNYSPGEEKKKKRKQTNKQTKPKNHKFVIIMKNYKRIAIKIIISR